MLTTDQILASLEPDGDDGASMPERLCRDCAAVLRLRGTTISLVTDGGLLSVAGASSLQVRELEELQFELGEGPTVDVCREGRASLHSDLEDGADARWPSFTPVALEAGIRGILALPLQVGLVRLGGLGLYSSTNGRVNDMAASGALAYADAAVAVLLDLQARTPSGGGLHPQLEETVRLRAEVHQATGFVSVQAAVSLTEALLLLRARAYSGNRPLLDVARDVLAGRLHIQAGDGDDV